MTTTHGIIDRAVQAVDDDTVEACYRSGMRAFLSSLTRLVIDRIVDDEAGRGGLDLFTTALEVSVMNGPVDDLSTAQMDEKIEQHMSRTDLPLKNGVPVPPDDLPPAPKQPWSMYKALMEERTRLVCATWLNTLPAPQQPDQE